MANCDHKSAEPPQCHRADEEFILRSGEGWRRKRRGWLRSGLMMVSSAALGGVAVALWNRRVLSEMRRQQEREED